MPFLPMTFDDDAIQLTMVNGTKKMLLCKEVGLEWPPPELLSIWSFSWRRVSMSEITDEERANMTHVFRGARYELAEDQQQRWLNRGPNLG